MNTHLNPESLVGMVAGFCRLPVRAGVAARSLIVDRNGSIAIVAAVALPVLLLAMGGALDFALFLKQRQLYQNAADAAVLAGAKGLSLSNAKKENVESVIKAVVDKFLAENAGIVNGSGATVSTSITDNPLEVGVTIDAPAKAAFAGKFGLGIKQVRVHATASVVGQPNICVLGLDGFDGGTISLESNSRVTGKNCAVFSNSVSKQGLNVKNAANLAADLICSAGGFNSGGTYSPEPMVDCPSFQDPLAGRPEPAVGACTSPSFLTITASQTLAPGVYCGGVSIEGSARVDLQPGVYVFKAGPLLVLNNAELHGTKAGLFFTGTGANLIFQKNTTISLTAPEDGVMAGLLIFASPSVGEELFRITSDNARTLLGTIYLPSANLKVDAGKPVADESAYTAIVARRMKLDGGPHLILNTDYHLTTVPVPGGIKGVGQPIRLSK